MNITEEEIYQKKQELGLEPPKPTHGPESVSEQFIVDEQKDAAESERANLVDHQNLDQPEGTKQRNQYRYGGLRP
jgi:hypothetical protein